MSFAEALKDKLAGKSIDIADFADAVRQAADVIIIDEDALVKGGPVLLAMQTVTDFMNTVINKPATDIGMVAAAITAIECGAAFDAA